MFPFSYACNALTQTDGEEEKGLFLGILYNDRNRHFKTCYYKSIIITRGSKLPWNNWKKLRYKKSADHNMYILCI